MYPSHLFWNCGHSDILPEYLGMPIPCNRGKAAHGATGGFGGAGPPSTMPQEYAGYVGLKGAIPCLALILFNALKCEALFGLLSTACVSLWHVF